MSNSTVTDIDIEFGWKGYLTSVIICITFIALCFEKKPAWLLLLCANVLLWITTVLQTKEALEGYSSSGLVTIVALFVVVKSISDSQLINKLITYICGDGKNPRLSLLKQMIIVFILSSFLNNTPIVSLLMPLIKDWAREKNLGPSIFLIPLSYSAILGGLNTIIGTSTNLVIQSFLQDPKSKIRPMNFFEIGYVGFPIGIICIIYMVTIGYMILPKNKGGMFRLVREHGRDFLSQIRIPAKSKLIGKYVSKWFLKSQLIPITLFRKTQIDSEIDDYIENTIININKYNIHPISDDTIFKEDDCIIIKASSSTIIKNINIVNNKIPLIELDYTNKHITELTQECYEIVFSHTNKFLGRHIISDDVQKHYKFTVIATRKYNSDENIQSFKDVIIDIGLTALVMADKEFFNNYKNKNDFYVISTIKNLQKNKSIIKEYIAISIIILTFVIGGSNIIDMDVISVISACLIIMLGIITPQEAIESIDWSLVIMIGASLGIGKAIEISGLADKIAYVFKYIDANIHITFLLYNILGIISTEIISNNASVAIFFPIGIRIATKFVVNPYPFVISSAICASAGFMIPFGYQTHIMVYGPGGYKVSDFIKVGFLMDIIFCIGLTILIPLIWTF